ncbi:LysR family transcriptional regulator [Methylopila henanensis]|uniref:LysR family transcriptional regulator n=1 Tax=Methylopila henanensis TaxID=873516 RepID=A0ABW4KAD7_9HYPH
MAFATATVPSFATKHGDRVMAAVKAQPRYDWNDIVYFLAVARQKNLARAAKALKVDHTTVGRRIRELERSLGASLFKRSRTGFTLTETGLRLLQHAEGMENQANALTEAVGAGGDAGGAVRIATMEGMGSLYLTTCFGAFRRQYPGIQIELITDTRTLDLTRREAEVFVSFNRPVGRRLSTRKIGEFRVSLYAAEAYFADRPRPTSARDLDEHDFIDFIDEYIHVRENRWLSDIFRPAHVGFRSTSLIAQYVSASSGQGIAMLPSFVAAHNPALIPVLPELSTVRDVWLSVHEDLVHIARIKAVAGFLEKRLAADRGFLLGETGARG